MTHWTESALCRDHVTSPDTDLWHEREGERGNPDEPRESPRQKAARIREAKAICAECPVRLSCLEDAITRTDKKPGPHGIRGGKTHAERKPSRGITHGGPYGAQVHRKRGETPCESCLDAERSRQREQRRRAKGAA